MKDNDQEVWRSGLVDPQETNSWFFSPHSKIAHIRDEHRSQLFNPPSSDFFFLN